MIKYSVTPPSLKSTQGFTLVELSIVIVIIGLIIAGVTAGKSLVRQAQLRSVITDINAYKVALNAFRLKYDSLPGDMPNAYDYWGAAAGCTKQDVNSVNAGCNGNGNGRVSFFNETQRAWQFLSLDKLIKGTYNSTSIGTNTCTLSSDCPQSSLLGGIFSIAYLGPFYGTTGNFFQVGSNFGGNPCGPVMTVTEAKSIDDKMDDGLPTKGSIYTNIGCGIATDGSQCLTADWSGGASSANFVLSDIAKTCKLLFWITK